MGDIDLLRNRLRRFRDERNWSRYLTPKDIALSINVEAAELLEQFQWRSEDYYPEAESRTQVAEEAADVLIYLIMLFDILELDPIEETIKKIRKNELRYPANQRYENATEIILQRAKARKAIK